MMNWLQRTALIAIMVLCTSCSQSGAEAQSTGTEETIQFATNWSVDKTASKIEFTGTMSGDPFTGSFSDYDAQIQFDPDNLAEAKVLVSIDMAKVDAGDGERNEALPGKDWFSSKAFPQAVFKANSFTKLNEDQYVADGELTIRDVTRPLALPFSLVVRDNIAAMNGEVSINRMDFGVGTGMWKTEEWVGHQVIIAVSVKASRTE